MRIHYLSADPDHFMTSVGQEGLARIPALAEALYALEEHLPEEDLVCSGITLIISRNLLATPLGLEFFKHCVYLNTVFHSYPNISSKAPGRGGLVKPDDFEHHLNSLRNLPVFEGINHVACLNQTAPETPALVVQPGPSLDPARLAQLRDRCLLIALGRTLPRLLEHGVTPDVIYQQDTSQHAWDASFGCLRGRSIPSILVANPAGHIAEYRDCFLRIYKSWNFYPFETDRPGDVINSIPPSTATGAFSLARHLGCNPIVSHGGDFGDFAAEADAAGEPGVDGCPCAREGDMAVFPPTRHLQYDIIIRRRNRPALHTSSDYLAASQWIKRMALRLKGSAPGLRFLDQSRTGLLTDFSPIVPFRPEDLEGRTRRFTPRGYVTPFLWTEHARELLRRFQGLRRILANSGTAPPTALQSPYNALFSGMAAFRTEPFALEPDDLALALDRADQSIAALEAALSAPGRS